MDLDFNFESFYKIICLFLVNLYPFCSLKCSDNEKSIWYNSDIYYYFRGT